MAHLVGIKSERVNNLSACVTCVWAGVDSLWEQKKPEARKLLVNRAESHMPGAPNQDSGPSFFHQDTACPDEALLGSFVPYIKPYQKWIRFLLL